MELYQFPALHTDGFPLIALLLFLLYQLHIQILVSLHQYILICLIPQYMDVLFSLGINVPVTFDENVQ